VAVTIRLRRMGTTKRPAYRVVVADSRSPRDGRFIEILGHYSPLTEPPTVAIDRAKVEAWIKKGAQPSNTVRKLIANAPDNKK
jgi:small subunit ribosomal protein S16